MGAWKQIAALPNPRAGAAAAFHAGKVYVFGGSSNSSGAPAYQSTVYIYDPAGNSWSSGAPLPGSGLCYAFATTGDGIHVVFPTDGSHYAYDPTTNTWATRTAVPGPGRLSGYQFTDSAGRFYLAGGEQLGGAPIGTAFRYDPTTDAWSARANLPAGLPYYPSVAPGVLGSDGKVYLGQGTNAKSLTVYDPASDAWTTTPSLPGAATSIYSVTVGRLPGGTVVTLPHQRLNGATWGLLRRIDGYTPGGGWTMGVTPDYPGNAFDAAVAIEPGGVIYTIGGIFWNAATVPTVVADVWAYKQNDPPTAPTPRTLTGGVTVSTESTNRASWTFNDPNAGDSQSKFNFYYRPTGTTTWTTVTKATPNPWYDIPAGTLDPVEYEWQVEVYDAAGEISPRTTSAVFTADDPPDGPPITYPINGQTVEQLETVVWSSPAQDAYQIRRVADDGGDPNTSTVYWDSGEVAEPLARSRSVSFPVNDRFEHVQARVKKDGLWSAWVDVQVDVSYTPPPTPTFTVYPDSATGSLLVQITNPAPGSGDPAAAYNDVLVDDGDGWERKVTAYPTNTGWRYWTPKSGRDYTAAIRVVAVAANGTTSSSE